MTGSRSTSESKFDQLVYSLTLRDDTKLRAPGGPARIGMGNAKLPTCPPQFGYSRFARCSREARAVSEWERVWEVLKVMSANARAKGGAPEGAA